MKIEFSRKTIAAGMAAALVLSLFVIFAIRYRAATGAYVNGERLLIAPINRRIEILRKRDPNRFSSSGGESEERRVKWLLLEERIAEKLIGQSAAKAGVTVSETEIDQRLSSQAGSFKDKQAYEKQLADEGLTDYLARDLAKDQIMAEKIRIRLAKETYVTKAEADNYLGANRGQFAEATPQVKLGVIVVATAADADSVIGALERGRLTWEKLATKYALNKNGIELGWQRKSLLDEAIDGAIGPLSVGGFTKALANPDNTFSIYRLEDRDTRQSTEAELPGQIQRMLLTIKQKSVFSTWFQNVYGQAEISTYL